MTESPEAPRFVLIAERDSPRLLAETAKVLASRLSIPSADAIAKVRYGGGLLAGDLTEELADAVQSELQQVGVSARKVEAERWAVVCPGYQVIGLEFLEDTLLARLPSDSELVIPRDEVFALDAYILEREPETDEGGSASRDERARGSRDRRDATRPAGGTAARRRSRKLDDILSLLPREVRTLSRRGQILMENLREAGVGHVELRFTLYCAEPTGPLHVRKDRFDYSCLGEQKKDHSLDNFLFLLEEVLQRYPDLWNQEPTRDFLADLDPKPILRLKREEVEGFHRWIQQWIRLEVEGRLARREES